MHLPFVSRDRLDEALRRIASLEDERKVLLDRIAMMHGEPPMFAALPVALAAPEVPVTSHSMPGPQPAAAAKQAVEQKKIVAGSLTPDYIRFRAAEAVRNKTVHMGNE